MSIRAPRLIKPAIITLLIILLSSVVSQANPQLSKFLQESNSPKGFLEHAIHTITQGSNLSESCSRDVQRFGQQLASMMGVNVSGVKTWAWQMLDAWAKIPEGILSGHFNALGGFDECLAVRAPSINGSQHETGSHFHGKYCLTYVMPNVTGEMTGPENQKRLPPTRERSPENLMKILSITSQAELPIIPTIGSCLPSTCSDEEMYRIVGSLYSHFNLIPLTTNCYADEPEKLSFGAIAIISLLCIIVGCVLLGTMMELAFQYHYLPTSTSFHKLQLSRVFLAFSIVSNWRRFSNTETGPNEVRCLCGIRFLGSFWIVLGHTYLMGSMTALWNLVDTYNMLTTSVSILTILNAPIVVEVFFVVAGFLVALTLLIHLGKSKGKLNVPLLYLSRYIRITPLYLVIIFFEAFLLPRLGSGPYWNLTKTWARFCQMNWWKNALYINNLPIYDTLNDPADAPCHESSWYLGVDMQLFFLAPFLLFPVWKWKRYGKVPLIAITIVAVLLPGILTYVENWLPVPTRFRSKGSNYFQEANIPTYMRATPYFIGMCTGLIYHSKRKKAFKLKRIEVIGGWLLAISVGITVLFGPHKFYTHEYNFRRSESAIYVTGYRTAWSLAISWLIFACATGYGGWINNFLSWRPFVPLGRLTFSVYLVSFLLQSLFHLRGRQPVYFSNYEMVNLAFAHLVMSCLVGLGCVLLIEAPCMQLLKLVLPIPETGRKDISPVKKGNSPIIKINNANEAITGKERTNGFRFPSSSEC